MSYTDLTGVKKINGIPVDVEALTEMIANQAEFKGIHDADEDLSGLDRDIVPTTDNERALGQVDAMFKEIFSHLGQFNKNSLSAGTLADLSLDLGNETTGFYLPQPGKISLVSNGVDVFSILGSGSHLKAANSTQLLIENTQAGNTGTWSIGVESNSMFFGHIGDGYIPKVEFSLSETTFSMPLALADGSLTDPSLQFGSSLIGGIHWEDAVSELRFSIDETSKVRIGDEEVEIENNKLICPKGYSTFLGLAFDAEDSAGFKVSVTNEMTVRARTLDVLELGNATASHVYMPLSVGYGKGRVYGPVTAEEVDVGDYSKLMLDCSAGDIDIQSFTGAQDGQILYLIKTDSDGVITVKHDDATASVKIYLKGNVDFSIGAGSYGGLILSYDNGTWKEVSRS